MPKSSTTKTLHKRNLHNSRYDFETLIKSETALKEFVKPNKYNDLSIDFSNPDAVIALNKALLSHFYKIKRWKIPKDYLCPPIPGRADYIHYVADLLSACNKKEIPTGKKVKALDIGVGANGIYPLIGHCVYDWMFVGSDIDDVSIENVNTIIENNSIKGIEVRKQIKSADIFSGIIQKGELFDFTMCNPPFHQSKKEAAQGTNRKIRNLTKQNTKSTKLNFGGQSNELWCKGGEVAFIKTMIHQSKLYDKSCFWFTTLVSKQESLPALYKELKQIKPSEIKTIEMKQGQKVTRFIAWTFLNSTEQENWQKNRWK